MALQRRRNVRQQHVRRLLVSLWQVRREMLEHVQRHRARLTGIHVSHVFARPAKARSSHLLQTFQINVTRLEVIHMRGWEVVPNDPDELRIREKAGGDRRVRGRTTKQIGVFFQGSFDGNRARGNQR